MNKFTKAFLTNSLGFNEDETKIVMKAQRQFPELLVEDAPIKSARKMYIDLGLNKTQWARWSKKNIIENTYFAQNKDWKPLDMMANADKSRADGNFAKDYTISVDMAKHLCMKADTIKAHEFRYFILMEKAIKKGIRWEEVRHPEKKSYKKMCEELEKNYMATHDGKKPNFTVYSNNADMLNRALFGYSSKQMKVVREVEYNDSLRDNLQIECNKVLDELQTMNSNLVINNLDYQKRKMIIETTCKAKFMDLRVKVVTEFNKELSVS